MLLMTSSQTISSIMVEKKLNGRFILNLCFLGQYFDLMSEITSCSIMAADYCRLCSCFIISLNIVKLLFYFLQIQDFQQQLGDVELRLAQKTHEVEVLQSELKQVKEFRRKRAQMQRELEEVSEVEYIELGISHA